MERYVSMNNVKYLFSTMTSTSILLFTVMDNLIKANPISITSISEGLVSHVTIRRLTSNLTSLLFPLTIPFNNDMVRHAPHCDYMPSFQEVFSWPRWICLRDSRSCPPLNWGRCFSAVTSIHSPYRAQWTFIQTAQSPWIKFFSVMENFWSQWVFKAKMDFQWGGVDVMAL